MGGGGHRLARPPVPTSAVHASSLAAAGAASGPSCVAPSVSLLPPRRSQHSVLHSAEVAYVFVEQIND